jgi:hypothetical protein
MIVYIAGPMTGLPDYNYPAFHGAEASLRRAGHDVLNPARRGVRDGWEWSDYIRPSLRDLTYADAICLLPGWETSRGASLEVHIADAIGISRLT